jgi:prephenate dehydrogenase
VENDHEAGEIQAKRKHRKKAIVTVGIIGYGRFGRLAAQLLAGRVPVVVHDHGRAARRNAIAGISHGTITDAAAQSIVILAVPVSALREVLGSIAGFLRPGALVVDVCAVKKSPVQWMKKLLPRSVSILGTHPLFGPDSCSGSVKGLRIVLCPVRGNAALWSLLKNALRGEGMIVEEMTPDEHDRMVARTVFLTQTVGRVIGSAGLARDDGGTVHYGHLRSIANVAANDSEQLFIDMYTYNPYARQVLQRLNRAVGALADKAGKPLLRAGERKGR